MKLEEQQSKLKELVDQFNQCNEQITMLQANNSELRMQIAKQQGVIEALQSLEKGSKNAKT
jgi:prefoldin subunit 5|tara:strand:+ start:1562 stop:1744 length:183 start_codon:yes stop_codon:yes gene_type:complete